MILSIYPDGGLTFFDETVDSSQSIIRTFDTSKPSLKAINQILLANHWVPINLYCMATVFLEYDFKDQMED